MPHYRQNFMPIESLCMRLATIGCRGPFRSPQAGGQQSREPATGNLAAHEPPPVLTKLEELELERNAMTSIPVEVCALPDLDYTWGSRKTG